MPPDTDIPYVTAGIVTLKYRFKRSCALPVSLNAKGNAVFH